MDLNKQIEQLKIALKIKEAEARGEKLEWERSYNGTWLNPQAEDAAWIADSGRFTQAVASGDFSEVEPFPTGMQVIVNRTAVIDAVKIPKFPTSQK
jgi:hypothetical protein